MRAREFPLALIARDKPTRTIISADNRAALFRRRLLCSRDLVGRRFARRSLHVVGCLAGAANEAREFPLLLLREAAGTYLAD